MNDSTALLLKELRLPTFVRHYQPLWETATEKGWSHTQYLAALCEYEISDRYQRRTRKWIREAQLAAGKAFTEFNDDSRSRTAKAQLARLKQDVSWAEHADNVLLIGPSGTGKTQIATALANQLIEHGIRCKLLPAIALVQLLQHGQARLRPHGIYDQTG